MWKLPCHLAMAALNGRILLSSGCRNLSCVESLQTSSNPWNGNDIGDRGAHRGAFWSCPTSCKQSVKRSGSNPSSFSWCKWAAVSLYYDGSGVSLQLFHAIHPPTSRHVPRYSDHICESAWKSLWSTPSHQNMQVPSTSTSSMDHSGGQSLHRIWGGPGSRESCCWELACHGHRSILRPTLRRMRNFPKGPLRHCDVRWLMERSAAAVLGNQKLTLGQTCTKAPPASEVTTLDSSHCWIISIGDHRSICCYPIYSYSWFPSAK